MGYDDLKDFEGRPYTGMAVGGEHAWIYPDGLWRETKVAPDRWTFTFASLKQRERPAPPGSGVPPGTQYHWYLLAHQLVKKLDADTYQTFMEGVKHKVAHRRPHWSKWSTGYAGNASEEAAVVGILERALADARLQEPPGRTVRLERFADTVPPDAAQEDEA